MLNVKSRRIPLGLDGSLRGAFGQSKQQKEADLERREFEAVLKCGGESIGPTWTIGSFTELCDFESRIELANEINRKYGRNLDWKQYGYRELLQIDEGTYE